MPRTMADRDGGERESRESVLSARLGNGLVSLFNGISTFVGYLMPKPFSEKNSGGAI